MALLEIDGVVVRFGGIVALDGVSFEVERGQVVGLIGPNGAGKTTLFNCITRQYTPDEGRIRYDGHDLLTKEPHDIVGLGIGRTFQNLGLFPLMTVRDNVMVGAHHRTTPNFVTAPFRVSGVRDEEQRTREEAEGIIEQLGLSPVAGRLAQGLPLGTLKRVELARALASHPELLLLDEPANGLNQQEVSELQDLILRLREDFDLTVLVVEHHMSFVMSISDNVVVLNFGQDIASGPPEEVRKDQDVIEAYLGTEA
ncbi:MAG: ABC transporter ATP-binding protein [Nitriliruptorales bacterium]|nr:ABC transporter ATP-binding protein [Nitriliruptorales bacterium]